MSIADGRLFFFARSCRGALTFLPTVSSLRLGHSCKPDGSRLLRRLRDQKSKQKSRRECDSLFSTDVEPGNRTFPGLQPLPVLRYQCKKPEVLFKPTVFIGRIERPVVTPSGGVPRPCRSAAPLPTPPGTEITDENPDPACIRTSGEREPVPARKFCFLAYICSK